jgi:DNA-binding NtrC family response regulator
VTREPLDVSGTFAEAKARAVGRFEAAYLDTLMRRCGWNITKASREAHVARSTLRALLKKRGLYARGDTLSSQPKRGGSVDDGARAWLHLAL